MKQKSFLSGFRNIGTSLLLVIFLVLCLSVFAVLSLSTAQSDYNLTLQQAEHTSAYYTACSKAEEKLKKIDSFLASCDQNNVIISQAELSELIGEDASVIWDLEQSLICFSEEINETQILKIELEVTNHTEYTESSSAQYYKIRTWQETTR